jgi:hypothetical protein
MISTPNDIESVKVLKVHQQQRCGAIEHQMGSFNHNQKGKRGKISVDISSSVSLIK